MIGEESSVSASQANNLQEREELLKVLKKLERHQQNGIHGPMQKGLFPLLINKDLLLYQAT